GVDELDGATELVALAGGVAAVQFGGQVFGLEGHQLGRALLPEIVHAQRPHDGTRGVRAVGRDARLRAGEADAEGRLGDRRRVHPPVRDPEGFGLNARAPVVDQAAAGAWRTGARVVEEEGGIAPDAGAAQGNRLQVLVRIGRVVLAHVVPVDQVHAARLAGLD